MMKIFLMMMAFAMAHFYPVGGEVIAGSQITVPIIAEIPEEAHGLIMFIDYDESMMEVIDFNRGDFPISEISMACFDASTPGRCRIGIICPQDGLIGEGVLGNIRFLVKSSCRIDQTVSISISEFYSMPLNGEKENLPYETNECQISVIKPTASMAIQIMRSILFSTPAPDWADVNEDGVVDTSDALCIMRWSLYM